MTYFFKYSSYLDFVIYVNNNIPISHKIILQYQETFLSQIVVVISSFPHRYHDAVMYKYSIIYSPKCDHHTRGRQVTTCTRLAASTDTGGRDSLISEVRRRPRTQLAALSRHEGARWPDCLGWAKIFNFKNAIAIWSSWFLEFGWKLQSSYADVGISNAIVFSSLSAVKQLVETHPHRKTYF